MVENLKSTIKNQIDSNIEKLKHLVEELSDIALQLTNEAQQKVAEEIKIIASKIVDLASEATKLGYNVTTCTMDVTIKLLNLEKDIISGLIDCPVSQIIEAASIVNETVSEVLNVYSFVEEFEKKVSNCIICDPSLVVRGMKLLAELPIKMTKMVLRTKTFVLTNSKGEVIKCIARQFVVFRNGTEGIIQNVSTCIADIIKG